MQTFVEQEVRAKIIYRSHYGNFVTIKIPGNRKIWDVIKQLNALPGVKFAEPNGIAHIFWTPNDPYYYLQWNFDTDHLDMPLAWNVERGGNSSVIISILDTGIAYKMNAIPANEQDEVSSNDGYYHISPDLTMTNFVDGYDFVNDDSLANDECGHGTHVCGTIAQSTNNAKGVSGMAFNVSIMPVRVLDETGSGTTDKIADGIYYAFQHGAKVLSMSFGGAAGDSSGFQTVHQAIIAATNAGAIVIAAAGNDGVGQLSYPAGFPECIAVGATDFDDNLAPYSQWGEGIDVVAPGGDLNQPLPGNDSFPAGILQSTFYQINDGYHKATVDSFCYMFLQGTSMATPHVSALAGLLISHGITDPSQVKQTIYSTCTDLGIAGYDTRFGYGIINPPLALGIELLFTSLPVIQNIYSQQYVDIWAISHRPLINDAPDTCKVTFNNKITYLTFEKIAEQTYRTDFSFDTSGTATIYVTARDTSGTKGTILKHFTVTKIEGNYGGLAISEDGEFCFSMPPDVYSIEYWVVISSDEFDSSPNQYTVLSNLYNCGIDGKAISNSCIVQFQFNPDKTLNPEDIGIYKLLDNKLHYVKTYVNVDDGFAYANVGQFGKYVLLHYPGKGESERLTSTGINIKCFSNPLKDKLVFNYTVPFTSFVSIGLYDVSGRCIKRLEGNIYKSPGLYSGYFDFVSSSRPPGIYFLRISVADGNKTFSETKKIVFIR